MAKAKKAAARKIPDKSEHSLSPDNLIELGEQLAAAGIRAVEEVGEAVPRNIRDAVSFIFNHNKNEDAPPLQVKKNKHVGDNGIDVGIAQRMLKAVESDPGPIDGQYGDRTKAAVIAFQKKNHIDGEEGELGEKTRATLSHVYKARKKQAPLEAGSIQDMQRALNALGYDAGQEDGKTGPKTRDAARQYATHYNQLADGSRPYALINPENDKQVLGAARAELVDTVKKERKRYDSQPTTSDRSADDYSPDSPVKNMQGALKGLGQYFGPLTSEMDDKTRKALKAFERDPYHPAFDVATLPKAKGLDYKNPAKYQPNLDILADKYQEPVEGEASFYSGNGGQDGVQGGRTASGMRFYRELPMVAVPKGCRDLYGCVLKIEVNGKTEYAIAADTGSFHLPKYGSEGSGRVLDMSESLARKLGYYEKGFTPVKWQLDTEKTAEWRNQNGLPNEFSGKAADAGHSRLKTAEATPDQHESPQADLPRHERHGSQKQGRA